MKLSQNVQFKHMMPNRLMHPEPITMEWLPNTFGTDTYGTQGDAEDNDFLRLNKECNNVPVG